MQSAYKEEKEASRITPNLTKDTFLFTSQAFPFGLPHPVAPPMLGIAFCLYKINATPVISTILVTVNQSVLGLILGWITLPFCQNLAIERSQTLEEFSAIPCQNRLLKLLGHFQQTLCLQTRLWISWTNTSVISLTLVILLDGYPLQVTSPSRVVGIFFELPEMILPGPPLYGSSIDRTSMLSLLGS